MTVPPAVAAYAHTLEPALRHADPDAVVGVYVHGSAVLGGWDLASSDVDVLIVVDRPVRPDPLAHALRQTRCPGRGLEASVVTAESARRAGEPWDFVLHVTTGPDGEKTVIGAGHPGDADLLMHYAVARAHGWAVFGPEPAEVFGPVARVEILEYLADELVWGLTNGSRAYALHNAARAWAYAETGVLISKVAGARWAQSRGFDLATVDPAAFVRQVCGVLSPGRDQ